MIGLNYYYHDFDFPDQLVVDFHSIWASDQYVVQDQDMHQYFHHHYLDYRCNAKKHKKLDTEAKYISFLYARTGIYTVSWKIPKQ
ncbi:hypothetical protein DERP_003766 [Dermatophagoides pteronyssinus]|uniref:Uncharacterized protein n=1 Tax=Dermatophagoides pteronyssinus TaxID=6956 RepID=A0ABQ8JLJ7_DERPT|nr:hypothetical protein DERP_003766 [Dermatophagoides pteronyssinus]